MIAGTLVLLGLTFTSVVAAGALTRRYEPASRSEAALFAGVAWAALIALPIYVLGFAGRLSAPSLAVGALLCHAAAIAVTTRWRAWRTELQGTLRFFARLAWAPFDLLVESVRARSIAAIGITAAVAALLYCAVVTWYAPSFKGWDPLWYHEPIVALTIQNHGFAYTDVPDSLQRVNGYPRLGEMLCLWFVVFTDRRLIELPSVAGAALYIIAVYTIARRFGASRSASAGWSTSLLFMPALFGELQSTMIDTQLAAFVACAFALGGRSTLRARDAMAAALAGALAINTKYLGLMSAFSIAGVVAIRLVYASRRIGRARVALALLLGSTLLALAVGITLVRNHLGFHSPFWPHAFEIEFLHYRSAGWTDRGPSGQEGMAEPWPLVVDYLFGSPAGWAHGDVHDGGSNYGLAPWVLLPCAALVVPTALWQRLRRLGDSGPQRRAPHAWDALRLLLIPLAVEVYASPAIWAARYNFGTLALLVGLAAAACSSARLSSEVAAGAFVLLALMTRHWSPAVLVNPDTLSALAKVRYPQREVRDALGAPIVEATGLARERELGPGDVVAVGEYYGNYPALLWNNSFSNRVVFVRHSSHFLEDASALHAKWIFLGDNEPERARALAAGWQEVGVVSVSRWGRVYRRP